MIIFCKFLQDWCPTSLHCNGFHLKLALRQRRGKGKRASEGRKTIPQLKRSIMNPSSLMNPRSSERKPLRHIPQRTCIACSETKPKRELIRIVRAVSGLIEVDLSGKKAGRGAYLCPTLDCWEKGLKGERLNRKLRTTITPENKAQLLQFSKMLKGKG